MNILKYIREAIAPGGTTKRYLLWVIIVLASQTVFSVYPSPFLFEPFPNLTHLVLLGVLSSIIICFTLKSNKAKIYGAYCLFIVGLVVSTITISQGITSLSGIIFMLTWSMTLFVAERREYITFDLVSLFTVLMLVSTIILLIYNPSFDVENNVNILITGSVITAINIFLIYIDFDAEKNFYQEYRRIYKNLEILSRKMSEILERDEPLESILTSVSHECIPLLGLEDCVIYLFDEKKNKLIQITAYGSKIDDFQQIINPLEIDPGKGVVGKCFVQEKPIIIEELKYYPDYIIDNQVRNSELAVPIISNGKTIGVIDSENSMKGFFKDRHVQSFNVIAAFCGVKITEYLSKKSIKLAREAQEEAERYRELDEMKQRFITNISHDLKTPLSLIKGPAAQILAQTTDKKIQSLAGFIAKNADHLLRVVNQLLQLNRTDEGLNELYLQNIKADELLNKVKEQYLGLAEEKNIDFQINAEPIQLISDAFRLEQVLHNLIHNAFRYTQRGGEISVSISGQEHLCSIIVKDNGPGIPVEIQGKIFERFFKADVNNHEGTGIGLSLVQEYVKSLNGTVKLESDAKTGTTFSILLPVLYITKKEQKEIEDEIDTFLPEDVKPIMLIAEDHADLNNFIASSFEDDFYCVSAFDGEEALKKIKHHIPDIIISDLMMPKISGNELIERIKKEETLAHIPIVVLSAKDQLNSKLELYDKGVENYLTKPFDIQELKAIVQNVLLRRRKLMDSFLFSINEPNSFNPAKQEPESIKKSTLVKKVLDYIVENIENSELNVSTICQELNVGRNKLQKEIKTEVGMTPVEFIRSIRLNEAKNLLSAEDITVSEVAYSVGFNNLSYFSRSFKTEFGVLPSEWIEQKG